MTKILVIDSDVSVQESVRRALERAGHDVAVASNGRLGMKLFNGHSFFIVIVDLFMPDQDGIEILRSIKSESGNVKILTISEKSGEDEPDFLTMTKALGASATLEKPFTSERLLQSILMLRNVVWCGQPDAAGIRKQPNAKAGTVVWRGRSGEIRIRKQIRERFSNVVWRGRSGETKVRKQIGDRQDDVVWRGRPRVARTDDSVRRPATFAPSSGHSRRIRPGPDLWPVDRQQTPAPTPAAAQPKAARRPSQARAPRRGPSGRTRRTSAWERLRRAVRHRLRL